MAPLSAEAEDATPIAVNGDVTYQFLARWDVDRLNKILSVDTPAFADAKVAYTPARNAVKLYRVIYPSVIPEHGNKPTITSGLVAIPDTPEKTLPLVSYQHGTVYGKHEVPSFPEESPETQLMIAQFAGQGYALIGAAYFGLGVSTEPESYMVKASHQQATADMVAASRGVFAGLGVTTKGLYLSGWSQGGFVTMALLEKLENDGVPVTAATTASAPLDIYAGLSGFFDFPRKNDAFWIPTIVILSAFSFENYYDAPGLAHSVLNDEYYELCKKAYDRVPFDAKQVPTDLHKLVRAEYFDSEFFTHSQYGKLAAETQSYRWVIKTPTRNYYGENDEAITVGIGRLAMTYQQAIGAGNPKVEAVSTGFTTHRGTFATAVPQWEAWFDTLSAP